MEKYIETIFFQTEILKPLKYHLKQEVTFIKPEVANNVSPLLHAQAYRNHIYFGTSVNEAIV